MIDVRIYITLKAGVLDNQGDAIKQAINNDREYRVSNVRQGKVIDLQIDAKDEADAEQKVHKLCETFLVNTIIEEYDVKVAS